MALANVLPKSIEKYGKIDFIVNNAIPLIKGIALSMISES